LDQSKASQDLEHQLPSYVGPSTVLQRDYNFSVKNEGDTEEDFLQALREQTGIVATPGRREITILELHR
jgi:hypothetical protein